MNYWKLVLNIDLYDSEIMKQFTLWTMTVYFGIWYMRENIFFGMWICQLSLCVR
jgi:hypothetical protein